MMKTSTLLNAALLSVSLLAIPISVQAQTTVVTPGNKDSVTQVTHLEDGSTVISVTVNNEKVAFPNEAMPVMVRGRVLVPLRGVVERLGGTIQYDATSKVITGGQANLEKQFRLRVGSDEALMNGQNMALDAPPRVLNGITYVPLRFISEALGADVRWDNANRVVTIMADGYSADVKATAKVP